MDGRLDGFSRVRVLIVGDAMLDRYWFGDVHRISPEAPVPVVRLERTEARLGGAANVARNVTALSAAATLLSVVGDDSAGREIAELAGLAGIDTGLLVDANTTTTVKLRVVGRQQQLLRIDSDARPTRDSLRVSVTAFEQRLRAADVVVLSDYGKGGLDHVKELIELAREAGKPVFVDPKGNDFSRYRGATVVTPNRAELSAVVGPWDSEEELQGKAQRLRQDLGIEALLVTRSEDGMTLFSANGRHHERTRALEVFDVAGAGDTVIAALAVARAAGADWLEAVEVANSAACIVVGKFGTAVAHTEELRASLKERK